MLEMGRLTQCWQRGDQGYPQSRLSVWRHTMDRTASTAVCVAGLAIAVLGVTIALGEVVEPGVVSDNPGGIVHSVDSGGFAWQDGVRPGQLVLALTAADEPEGWWIQTRAGDATIDTGVADPTRLLRAIRPVALLALVLSLVGLVLLPRNRKHAEALASLAVLVASLPIGVQGNVTASSAAFLLALGLPVSWLARWGRLGLLPKLMLTAAALAVAGTWLALRAMAEPTFVPFEQARLAISLAGALAIVGVIVRGRQVSIAVLSRPRLIDALSVGLLVVALALVLVMGVPIIAIGVGSVLAMVLYPSFRRFALATLDRLFLAEQRERQMILASEAERARLARELHDAPLQELAGVIKRLETVPEAKAEGDALRQVAQQLRQVTTELHPPILDDLGVASAIEFLVHRARNQASHTVISVEVVDHAGIRPAERPPAEVELNVFRIVQEALANALRHAPGSAVTIHGEVGRYQAMLTIEDDGPGVSATVADAALRSGRLGVASMRRRAEAIGARLEMSSQRGGGTRVSLQWEAEK